MSTELDKIKESLREKQENLYGNAAKIYVEITIPETGKVGEWCVIKFNKKVPKAELAVSEKIEWKRKDKYDIYSKPEMVPTAFIIEKADNVDEIKFKWEDIGYVATQPTNLLRAGEYLVEVKAYSTQAYEETIARRLVQVSK